MNRPRYNSLSAFLRERFGCRVQKITVDAGFSCPNRDGVISRGGCVYCDGNGSGTGAALRGESIRDQIRLGKSRLAARYKARKFMAYFQAYSNTYGPCDTLRRRYDEALEDPDVVGLAIGTRPDCIDESRLDLIQEYTETHMVWLEYGLQSMHNRTLSRINRGHKFEDFVLALQMTRGRNILICAHVIIGLPGESTHEIVETAKALSRLDVDGVKIHSLYVVDKTPMAGLLQTGAYTALDQQEYADLVVAFLERLSPKTVVQRLTGDPDPLTLIGPGWALNKQKTLALIHERLEGKDTWQGRLA
jgi:radical SAM protein (TIGR01212 family)